MLYLNLTSLCATFFFMSILGFALRVRRRFFVRLCASTWMFEWQNGAEVHTYTHELRGTRDSYLVRVDCWLFDSAVYSIFSWSCCLCHTNATATDDDALVMRDNNTSHTWWRRSSSVARCVQQKFKHTYVFPVVNVFVLALTTTTSTLSSGRNFNSTSLRNNIGMTGNFTYKFTNFMFWF